MFRLFQENRKLPLYLEAYMTIPFKKTNVLYTFWHNFNSE